jgi:DNA-binding SARP family transcriptional activator/tetratricopeptide (TPR) repeat protein
MDFHILGPIEAIESDGPLALGGSKQRALLGMLLLHAGEVVSSDRLIDELWPGERREEALKALQVAVSRLRRALEPDRPAGVGSRLILTRPPGYELRLDDASLDARRFEALLHEGRRELAAGDPRSARAKLDDALGLWRGPPLADLAYESFCQAEVGRLQELRMSALEERIAAELELGRHAEVVGELGTLVREQPLRERLRGQLMLALYRSGRQAEALDAYADARRTLVEELGIEPARELRELHQAILEQDPRLDIEAPSEPATETAAGVFVGRKAELGELLAGVDDVFAGRGRLFLVAGEPGIGKSRLAEELVRHAAARGARVLIGRCWEAGGAPAHWPWVQSLRAYARATDDAALGAQLGPGAAELAQILPELRERFRDLPEPRALDSEGARFRLFDATAEFLRSASEKRPIVLILDDLHAADAPSLLLLRFLAQELGTTRVLLAALYRDVDPLPGQPLTEMLATVSREPLARRLTLDGLSESEVAEYVDAAAPEIASAERAAALHAETGGNPLFVGEIVQLLAVEGVRSDVSGGVQLGIPQTVQDVIARRLSHLSEEGRRILVLASVIGREFDLATLARMADLSEDELLDRLDEPMAARVISDLSAGTARLRFSHVLIRDTLYQGLTSARRVRLHRLAVDAIEALHGSEPGPHLAELAHHSVAGRDLDRALDYARRAGDRALALLAYEESARLYRMALDTLQLAGSPDDNARCDVLLRLGEANARAGDTPAAKRAFLDAARIARELALPRELARAAAGYGGRIVWERAGDDGRLVPLLEEGLAALGNEDVELRARLLARLAGALRDEHSRDRRDSLSREAVEHARRTGNAAALAYALDGRAAVIIGPDTIAECLALGTELCEVAERIGDMERVAAGHSHRIIAQLQTGDVRGAQADLAAASRIAEELRQPAQLWQYCASRALLALAAGELSRAEELVAEAFALGERAQPTAATPVYVLQRYALCDFRGRLSDVEADVRGLVASYPNRPVFRCALALLDARLGRTSEATRELEELTEADACALPFDQEWLYGMSLLAETAALLRHSESAAVLYRLLLPWASLNVADVGEGIRGSAARYLGMLAAAVERFDEAEPHFDQALALNASMEARPWLAHTASDYARMLRARNGRGDGARADELIEMASRTYRELGMDAWAGAAAADVGFRT